MSSLKMWGAPRPVSSPQQVGRHPAGVSWASADGSRNLALNDAYPGHRYIPFKFYLIQNVFKIFRISLQCHIVVL